MRSPREKVPGKFNFKFSPRERKIPGKKSQGKSPIFPGTLSLEMYPGEDTIKKKKSKTPREKIPGKTLVMF